MRIYSRVSLRNPRVRDGCLRYFAMCAQSDVSPTHLEELEEAELWIDTQAMLAEMEEQEERLQMSTH